MPKKGQSQSKDHPWFQRQRAAIAEHRAKTLSQDPPGKKATPWVCPSCGQVDCAYQECLGGSY